MGTLYDDDVVAWAEQQAALIRARQWAQLDVDNIAEEIEDVGKSDKRALRNHMVVLLEHLLTWAYQPLRRGASWSGTIGTQRDEIEDALEECPSLKNLLSDPEWLATAYRRAVRKAQRETGLNAFPAELPWQLEQVLNGDFLPPQQISKGKKGKKVGGA
ncbi:protein of unknown function DUF29 [Duganella sp. CF517]|uniref:DUF29 domain-containing protein n=1 Tax=Duganella sp. CF517 TaxID=1881038 RepID=UPI0008C89A11|nr:DUF29 domain-containing protein [Duganella sp. CF517]SEN26614.1 protein of unknown function DUF29 [Duganella sp. CF517]